MDREILYTPEPHKMYVEHFNGGLRGAVVLIHGGFHNGVCWTQTPDGRKGWALILADQGYDVYVVDLPGVGRSGFLTHDVMNGEFIIQAFDGLFSKINLPVTIFCHSLSGPYGFILAERYSKQVQKVVAIEPGPFGNIQEETKPENIDGNIVKVIYKGLPFNLDMSQMLYPSKAHKDRFICLNKKDNLFPEGDSVIQQYLSSLQPIHPRLMYERFNINGTQIKIENPKTLLGTKCLIITTPDDPLHADEDPKISEALKSWGVNTTHWLNGEQGTEFNSHMLMVEKNNEVILHNIIDWMEKDNLS